MGHSTRPARWPSPAGWWQRLRRSGCGSGGTGIRAAACRSMSSTPPAHCPRGSGCRIRECPPIVAEADAVALIRGEAERLGFSACGFTTATLPAEARARLNRFLAEGQHGEMGWMQDRAAQRVHPQALWPEAVSVIALGLSYAPAGDPLAS